MNASARTGASCVLTALSLLIVACGSSNSVPSSAKVTYLLTVNSAKPFSGAAIAVAPADINGSTDGSTSFTRTYYAGSSVTLTAPAASAGSTFSAWAGCTAATGATCTVNMTANTTVTASYSGAVLANPAVGVTPAASSVTTAQDLAVSVAVNGPAGMPTPTGNVVLTSSSYTSAATPLTGGNATITIPAGSLPAGNDVITVTYTPDAAGSTVYNSASGAANVSVTTALFQPIVTVTPAQSTVITSQALPVAVSVASSAKGPAPTGSITLSSGAYTSMAAALISGSATVTIPANTLPTGSDTLHASYTPDAPGASLFSSASGTAVITVVTGQISSITLTPNPASATIGGTLQFTAKVTGTGTFSPNVTWSITPSDTSASPGTISSTGLYTTPYPAPATVKVTATSTQDPGKSGSVTVTLNAPAAAAGPALTVDTNNKTHAISSDIYGVNAYSLDTATITTANLPLTRWGGNNTSRYNFQLGVSNSGSDYFFENSSKGAGGVWPTGQFDDLVSAGSLYGVKVLGTANLLGWVAKDGSSCSFPKATYASQYAFDPNSGTCGDGEFSNQSPITGNDPTAASTAVDIAKWDAAWVSHLTTTYGNAASSKGVAIWDLDNEPEGWDVIHRDVHPLAATYDEMTNTGIAAATSIKAGDPTALVSGPVVSNWWNYFYSKQDMELGWAKGAPCYQPWSDPADRKAHSGKPFIEYYLQQFKTAETTAGKRLLDYLDVHAYFAAVYNKASVGLAAAGDTAEQQIRLNSTRVFWDPTYTDPNYPQPNYVSDANYDSADCNPPLQSPQLIPMMKTWVANDYPGTKLAIDEYNFGGMESINGALTEADILGIFGREGLDLAALWPTTNYSQQVPGTMAIAMYRNYDGANSTFGDSALASTSADQGKLSVYGAVRTTDKALTIVVINKTYGDLTSTLSLPGLSGSITTAKAYLYSSADPAHIVARPAVTVAPPSGGATASTITTSFPAQSITLLVIPN